MDNNNKKILIIKNQNQSQYQTDHETQKNILKQNEQNPNLSETGETTTTSVSNITKNNHIKGNYKTPKKKNFQIPVKKNVKTVSPDFPNKTNKIYSKGFVKKFPYKKEQNQILNNSNNNNNNTNNNTINNNAKQYNRSLSQLSIEQMKNNISNNNNTIKNNQINNTINNGIINNKASLYNIPETNKNQLSSSCNNSSCNNKNNIYFTKKKQSSIKNFL